MIDWFDLAYYIVCIVLLSVLAVGVVWLGWKTFKKVMKG